MRVFVTGATGFVGRQIVQQLLDNQHTVRALVRGPDAFPPQPDLETVVGDVTSAESLTDLLSGCEAVIHLVGIIREFGGRDITFERLHTLATGNIVAAAQAQGVQRYIQMSANGTRANAVSRYHQTKWAAEEIVRGSQLDWTIFRPSLIYGPNDEFVNMLAGLIRRLPVVPVMGDGTYRLQPVHVRDVARSFVTALAMPQSVSQTYSCCGIQAFSYDQLLDQIGQALGLTRVRKIHQPLALMKPVVGLLQSCPLFPMTSDQLQMLLEGNICTDNNWAETFQLEQPEFSAGIAEYL
ncbi:MAG: NAD-dependent dehydratase [Desulfuromonas sp.]|nr:MAG: NAD-dependent dehydratase [Desulfuromonas sp.]